MRNLKGHFIKTLISVFAVMSAIFIYVAYASLSTVNPGDNLTSAKWNELVNLINNHDTTLTNTQTALNAKAPLASPVLTGTPTAPTPTNGDISQNVATTAFVEARVASAVGGTTGCLPVISKADCVSKIGTYGVPKGFSYTAPDPTYYLMGTNASIVCYPTYIQVYTPSTSASGNYGASTLFCW